MNDSIRLLMLCAAESPHGRIDPQLLARTARTSDSLDDWYAGKIRETSDKATRALRVLHSWLEDADARSRARSFVDQQLDAAAGCGARVTTVVDGDYPANLRLVPDAPPFLFYRGDLSPADARSLAVVGTRQASDEGISRARRIAAGLAAQGAVIVSGLAAGIDAAAHRATIGAGRRTIAVVGQGIATNIYPRQNRPLAEEIVGANGAIVSQFWPTDTPDRWRFPARNITMSGLTQGTIVVEASATSGAKLQAEAACRHGKFVFLLHSLTTGQPWAADMLRSNGCDAQQAGAPSLFDHALPSIRRVFEVSDLSDVLQHVAEAEAVEAAAAQRQYLAEALRVAM